MLSGQSAQMAAQAANHQGQAVADFPRLHEEAIEQSWAVYFLLLFPLIIAAV